MQVLSKIQFHAKKKKFLRFSVTTVNILLYYSHMGTKNVPNRASRAEDLEIYEHNEPNARTQIRPVCGRAAQPNQARQTFPGIVDN